MLIILVIGAFVFFVLAYLLFVPINVRLEINIGEKTSAISRVRIFPFEHEFVSGKAKKVKKKEKLETKKAISEAKKPPEKVTGNKFKLSQLNRTDIGIMLKVITEALRFLGGVISAPHYFLRATIAGGASEPDITGELFGAYHAIRPVLPEAISISYNPDFAAERFSGRIEAGFVIRIFSLINETLIFIIRLPIIKLIRLYRKLRKEG